MTEAATKTAQFTDIVALLLEAGADTETTDHMGNTPLHNTVLYFPSTMRTLDLLLAKGADVSVKNNEGSMPFHLSDDKDLKFVLKELKKSQKLAAKGDNEKTKVKSYSERPDLRKLVCDLSTGTITNSVTLSLQIWVKFHWVLGTWYIFFRVCDGGVREKIKCKTG